MPEGPKQLKCAVYTRKSTEDGLEQEFNSLDAQFEACSAYVISQQHEGWQLVNRRYDDGGFSGGNMERPGLKQLLGDVQAGDVDVIVIYKIDRLTRSLSDFSRIVEVLDGARASFVSVTQAFNTTTSMGRLMLNVLLSFAQFEREVTGERIRDKIAASKRKGLWMGGPVPLGYDVRDRKLIVNETEAELVRHIMRRYCELPGVPQLVEELRDEGRLTKRQNRASGPHRGAVPFARGTLYHLLSNRIYLGEITHRGSSFPGAHASLVPEALWNQVQAKLARHHGERQQRCSRYPYSLSRRLTDGLGRAMIPSHTAKGARRYHYYITAPDMLNGAAAWRVAAHDLERLVKAELSQLLRDQSKLHQILLSAGVSHADIHQAWRRIAAVAALLEQSSAEANACLRDANVRVTLLTDKVQVYLDAVSLSRLLGLSVCADAPSTLLECDAARIRVGKQIRLVVPGPSPQAKIASSYNPGLAALLAEAYWAWELVDAYPNMPLNQIARDRRVPNPSEAPLGN